ncbi:hypothetical protein OWR29_25650 [Actinoplanes sp. Pm04-4]|uniref:DUF2188 domain-containing protein n=1 Tax=Paractinoplanes pyxinae TaxID=2997416 RepID=A0ABT4B4G9_9ACTN|nr:hypothetical protein [Actinoplanes pyxinae]MCY1141398.1 hypothetical protein [Actinoplanes pyxinae]
MSARRFFVFKKDGDTGRVSQVGTGSKTFAKAQKHRAQMRAVDAQRHGSNSYTFSEGRKSKK